MICPEIKDNPQVYSIMYCDSFNFGKGCKHKETCISYKKELQSIKNKVNENELNKKKITMAD